MKKFKHLSFIERCNLKEALESDIFKKKNGTLNISKITIYMSRSKSTIKYHLKHYKHIKRYHPMQEHKRYLKNHKNCKKKTTLTFKQSLWLDEKFNKFHYTPKQICKLYKIEFNDKFPMFFKTLYKYIYLGLFGLNKRNLYFHSKKKIHKGKKYKRGNLSNDFRTIKQAKHEKGTFGWFQMDTIVGKDKKSACLTLTEKLTKFTFLKKLKEKNSTEVLETLKQIFKNKLLKKHLKVIITDQGKEFWNWKDIEKHLKTNVYFCDKGSPTQIPIVERMNRYIRRELPKSTDFRIIKQDKIDWIINTINDKIRSCLNWETPTQLFNKYIK